MWFGRLAPRLRELGYDPFPTEGKQPLVRNWTKPLSPRRLAEAIEKFPDANVAVLTHAIFAVDIDIDDEAAANEMAAEVQRLIGPTDYIRVGRWPRRAAIYGGEVPTLKFGAVELRGRGAGIVTHGLHPETGKPYYYPLADIADTPLERLPRATNLSALLAKLHGDDVVSGPALQGERNTKLFAFLRAFGQTATSREELDEAALQFPCDPPLSRAERLATSKVVWSYKQQGRLIAPGQRDVFTVPLTAEQVQELARDPYQLAMMVMLYRTRPRDRPFTIAQEKTALYLGCGKDRLAKTIRAVTERGFLLLVDVRYTGQPQPAYFYRFGQGSVVGIRRIGIEGITEK